MIRSHLTAWVLGAVLTVSLFGNPAAKADVRSAGTSLPYPVVDEFNTSISMPERTGTWTSSPSWWDVANQGEAFAFAKFDGEKTRLEAMSSCHSGNSSRRADAKVVYRFQSLYDGFVEFRPTGAVWGQLLNYPATAGVGEATARITLTLRDVTMDEELASTELLDEKSPEFILDTVVKRKPLENRIVGDALSSWHTILLESPHVYEVEVKLWTECATHLLYEARADFSRYTISPNPDDPLLGMVLITGIDFKIPEGRD